MPKLRIIVMQQGGGGQPSKTLLEIGLKRCQLHKKVMNFELNGTSILFL